MAENRSGVAIDRRSLSFLEVENGQSPSQIRKTQPVISTPLDLSICMRIIMCSISSVAFHPRRTRSQILYCTACKEARKYHLTVIKLNGVERPDIIHKFSVISYSPYHEVQASLCSNSSCIFPCYSFVYHFLCKRASHPHRLYALAEVSENDLEQLQFYLYVARFNSATNG